MLKLFIRQNEKSLCVKVKVSNVIFTPIITELLYNKTYREWASERVITKDWSLY